METVSPGAIFAADGQLHAHRQETGKHEDRTVGRKSQFHAVVEDFHLREQLVGVFALGLPAGFLPVLAAVPG